MKKEVDNENLFSVFFLILPTLFVIAGLLFFPFPVSDELETSLLIPLFVSLIILGMGFLIKKERIAGKL